VFSFKNLRIPSVVLSASKLIGEALLLPGKNFKVGNPLIDTEAISFYVESHLAITMLEFFSNFYATSSQAGTSFLQ